MGECLPDTSLGFFCALDVISVVKFMGLLVPVEIDKVHAIKTAQLVHNFPIVILGNEDLI